MTIPG